MLLVLSVLSLPWARAQDRVDAVRGPAPWNNVVILQTAADDGFRGIERRIADGTYASLGASALQLPYFFLNENGGTVDFTEVDPRWGSPAELRRVVDAAHAAGLRIIVELNLNEAATPKGPESRSDANAIDSATVDSATVDSATVDSATADSATVDSVAMVPVAADGWGPGWIRADRAGYEPCGNEPVTACFGGQPDFRTEVGKPTDIPGFLLARWDSTKAHLQTASLDAFFARTKYPRTPRYYMVKWTADWIRDFGFDGAYVGNLERVDVGLWPDLKKESVFALRDWMLANEFSSTMPTEFWLSGAGAISPETAIELRNRAFDALVTERTTNDLAETTRDSLYAALAPVAGSPDSEFGGISLVPESVFGSDAGGVTTAAWLFVPGPLALPGEAENKLSSDSESAWNKVSAFRRRHPAVGAGEHRQLGGQPYTFQRSYRVGGTADDVIVVIGAEERLRINVSSAFPDDAFVRDAVTGKTAFVSFGYVTFTPDSSGLLLLELAD